MRELSVTIVSSRYGELAVRRVGEGSPVVVLPGGPGWGCEYLIESLTALLRNRFALVFLDQRGAGLSAPGSGPMTMDAYVDDVFDVCNALGLDRFGLFGTSFGGLQALHCAMKDMGPITSLCLADPDPPTRQMWARTFAPSGRFERRRLPEDVEEVSAVTSEPGWADDQAKLDRYLIARWRNFYTDPRTAESIKHGLTPTRFAQFNATSSSVRDSIGDWDIRQRLPGIDVPTLLVCCRESIFDGETPQTYLELLPDASLSWTGGGHLPFIEDPAGFAAAVEAFYA